VIHIDGTRNLILLFSTSHAQHDGCRVVDRDSPGLRRGIAGVLRKLVSELERQKPNWSGSDLSWRNRRAEAVT
jgi:hypothetical protein